MKQREVSYHVVEEIGSIPNESAWDLEVNKISWNGAPPKIDIRRWNPDRDKMSKGISLTKEEAKELIPLLKEAIKED